MKQPTNIFDHFRKQSEQVRNSFQKVDEVFFQLLFDAFGAFLKVINKHGVEVEVNYLNHGGAERHVLRLIDQIQDRNSFLIDWEKPSDFLYLSAHEHLIEQLKHCDNIVNEDMQPLQFTSENAVLRLLIKPIEGEKANVERFRSQVVIEIADQQFENIKLLSDQYILIDRRIVSVKPLGSQYNSLAYFNTVISENELVVFLSLFFSNVENVEKVSFKNYTVKLTQDKVHATPSLIFEKIDADDSLLMRVGQSLPEVGMEIMDQFELFRLAEINELEKIINVKFIEREPLEQIIKEIEQLLKQQTPKKSKDGIKSQVIREDELFIIPKEIAANFIYNELPGLLTKYQLFGAEKLKSYKVTTTTPKLSLNLTHNIDFFEGDVTLNFDGEELNLFDVLNQFNKNRYVQLSDGTQAVVNEKYMRQLERIFKKGKDNIAKVSFFDLPVVEEIIEGKTNQELFRKPKAFYEGLSNLEHYKVQKPIIEATLRPYQEQGYKWLHYMQDHQLGGCLADDMGLGKTLQTITLLADIYEKEVDTPSLIIMPKSLLYNWQREVKKFAPQLSTYIFHGNDRDLEIALKTNLILTTYSIARNEIEVLKEIDFLYIILDESQNIKNVNALTTKAVMLLKSKHRLALSGTPVENNLGELYSLFRFLNPTMFGSINQFNRDYLTPIQKHNDKIAMQHLRKKIYPFILRRLKKDVLTELPDKIEQTLYVEMSDDQKRLYEQRKGFYQAAIGAQIAKKGVQGAQFFIFQALNELRQIASIPEHVSDGKVISPKRELLQEQLLDTIANGHKALVFANYLIAVELIGEALDEAGINYVSMTGATRDRQQLVDRFQNEEDCKVFIMTLKTGGTGLNLTAADTIFIFDPWWNVAAENQAIDRAHRFGQMNKVIAYKLITQNTIEEKILQLQQLKKELFDNVITTDGSALKSLTEDDISFILGGSLDFDN